jgi:hypothetical protein
MNTAIGPPPVPSCSAYRNPVAGGYRFFAGWRSDPFFFDTQGAINAAFPDNGRSLTDDVADIFITIITDGKQTSDNVGCHSDLLAGFPYVGPPHQGRSPR